MQPQKAGGHPKQFFRGDIATVLPLLQAHTPVGFIHLRQLGLQLSRQEDTKAIREARDTCQCKSTYCASVLAPAVEKSSRVPSSLL